MNRPHRFNTPITPDSRPENVSDLPNDATLHYYLSELSEESVSDLTANEIDRCLRFAESLCAASRDHISPENQLAINSLLRAARLHRGLDVNTYVDLLAATGRHWQQHSLTKSKSRQIGKHSQS